MSDELINRLRQMDKEELIKENLSLRQKNESLLTRSQQSEERFNILTDNIQASVYLLDEEGLLIYANPFTTTLTGYTNDELLGLESFKLVHPDFRTTAKQRNQSRLRDEETTNQYDIKFQTKDDQVKWVELGMRKFTFQGRPITLGTAIDITDRKKAEKELRRSEEKFKAFTENLQVMVYTYDSKGKFTYLNKKCEELTGYAREELMGMNFTVLLHDDYKKLSVKRATARRENENIGECYDYKGVKKDGSYRWWELSGIVLESENEDHEKTVLGNAIDITDRVESQLALQESERKFRTLFERSSDPMLLLDKEGFFDCNQATLKLLKAENKAQIIAHPGSLSPEFQPDGCGSREKAIKMIKQAYTDGFLRFEWLHQDRQGNNFWTDVSLTVVPFENRDIIFTVWRDISAIKELEHLLRDEREQLLVTLRSIGDAVITTDLDRQVILMNRVAEKLTGWQQAEAQGRNVGEILTLINGETGAPACNPLDQAISQGMILELAENTVLRSKNGQEFKISDSASPIRDDKSKIIGGVLVFRDVTIREQMQDEVLKLRKLESVGRLAGGIAHDFNNLLTGIMGNIEISTFQLAPEQKNIHKNLTKALNASRRAADLTQKLLTFAKGGEPIKSAAAIGEIIRDSAEFSLLGSKIALSLTLPKNLWAAEVDAGQISQVIQNLVINSVQAMPDGGTIFINCRNINAHSQELHGLPLKPGPYIKISVRDQGCGIDLELHEKIFDPFFTTKNEGSGLGLSVIHSIIKKHNGYIGVQSQPDLFTEFNIFLPALGMVSEKPQKTINRTEPPVVASRILVMDDEELVREILTEILTTVGYEVEAVCDGQQALEIYQQQKFAVVIMDLTIPGGMGGRETIEFFKDFDPQVKAIVSSGYANDPIVAEYEKYGFCGFLNKPYIVEDLLKLLKRVLTD